MAIVDKCNRPTEAPPSDPHSGAPPPPPRPPLVKYQVKKETERKKAEPTISKRGHPAEQQASSSKYIIRRLSSATATLEVPMESQTPSRTNTKPTVMYAKAQCGRRYLYRRLSRRTLIPRFLAPGTRNPKEVIR